MNTCLLGAIRFESGDIDGFLSDFAATVAGLGLSVRGALQSRGAVNGACHCADMDLHMIGSSRTFRISQPLGNGSSGCRLHPGALAECSTFLERELDDGPDLLILNRFGRGESEGRGFRDLIGKAVALHVPVLTAVRPTYAEAWAEFGAGLACDLPMDMRAVSDWFAANSRFAHSV